MPALFSMLTRWLGRDDRRRHRRVHGGDVLIDIDGESVEVVDWSPGGFRAAGFQAPPPRRGTFVKGSACVGRVSGPYTAFVVAEYDDGSIGARFDEIDTSLFRALADRRR